MVEMQNKLKEYRFFDKLNSFGGSRLILRYIKIGVLHHAIIQFVDFLLGRIPLREANYRLQLKIMPKLEKEFSPILKELEQKWQNIRREEHRSNFIWFCWLQGLDDAPMVVKVCYTQLKRNLRGKQIVLITKENLKDYVDFPPFIIDLWNKGIIPNTNFSDMLRANLLVRHGGTWIDSTIFCSDNNYPEEIFDSDLFVYQQWDKDTGAFQNMQSWFMTSCTNNIVITLVLELMYEYWKRYDCLVDYFIFFFFFRLVSRDFKCEIEAMPKYDMFYPMQLCEKLHEQYDENYYHELCKKTHFHKLTYKLKFNAEREGTFYDVLIQKYPLTK